MTTEQKLSQVIEWAINKMYFLYEEGNHYSENDIQRVAQAKAHQLLLEAKLDASKITRVEVIDDYGRAYVNTKTKVDSLDLQDDNRTLKIFITNLENTKQESTSE